MIVIKRTSSEHTLSVTIADRTSVVDMSGLKPWQCAKLTTRLFEWKQGGAVGFPNLKL
jgi:hypothetical protein